MPFCFCGEGRSLFLWQAPVSFGFSCLFPPGSLFFFLLLLGASAVFSLGFVFVVRRWCPCFFLACSLFLFDVSLFFLSFFLTGFLSEGGREGGARAPLGFFLQTAPPLNRPSA